MFFKRQQGESRPCTSGISYIYIKGDCKKDDTQRWLVVANTKKKKYIYINQYG